MHLLHFLASQTPHISYIFCQEPSPTVSSPKALSLLHSAHGNFQSNLGFKALLPHQSSFLVSPCSTPHPLPLVRVDQYFPCSLSLMWNWLFVQSLLCLHKDLDRGNSTKPKCTTDHFMILQLRDALLDFYCLEKLRHKDASV